jgi:hypothetical protein
MGLREITSDDQLRMATDVEGDSDAAELGLEPAEVVADQVAEAEADTTAVESLPSMDAREANTHSTSEIEPEPEPTGPQTMRELYALVDDGWRRFRSAAGAFPSERMDEKLDDGWTRKQMLAHISAWHDQTHERLGRMLLTGEPEPSDEDTDKFNARVARQAIGRTAGEILQEMEMTFNRLRRQIGRLNDEQLVANEGWAAWVIGANTYGHYEEHAGDVYQPPPPDGRSGRR